MKNYILSSKSDDFDYALLDSGEGRRLERFGKRLISRPDGNVLWSKTAPEKWHNLAAEFKVGSSEKGWEYTDKEAEEGWTIAWKNCRFLVKPTPFRHMGLFPEQAVNWEWLREKIVENPDRKVRVLNLFAYTGAASVVAAKAGAQVCHVDASVGSIKWAQDNARASNLSETAIRWIADDVLKFLRREVRRGNHYDVIMLDPPVFGRGPKGEIFRLEERLEELLQLCNQLLSEKPLGFLLNFYATALYPESVARLATSILNKKFNKSLELASLCIEEEASDNLLPTGFLLRS